MPIIVSIENRERNSVVVELVGFEFANHVVQAVGNTLCTSQSFLADIVVIVCDATCLRRSLHLVLQCQTICENVLLCVNLMDEAEKQTGAGQDRVVR